MMKLTRVPTILTQAAASLAGSSQCGAAGMEPAREAAAEQEEVFTQGCWEASVLSHGFTQAVPVPGMSRVSRPARRYHRPLAIQIPIVQL